MILFGELNEGGRVEVSLTSDITPKLVVNFKAKKVIDTFKPKVSDEKTSQ